MIHLKLKYKTSIDELNVIKANIEALYTCFDALQEMYE